MKKLKPCPFCGKPASVRKVYVPPAMEENEVPSFDVGCEDVSCRGFVPYSVLEANIPKEVERWNKRAPERSDTFNEAKVPSLPLCKTCRRKSDKKYCHYGLLMNVNKRKCAYWEAE
jgi:hypothetical protein